MHTTSAQLQPHHNLLQQHCSTFYCIITAYTVTEQNSADIQLTNSSCSTSALPNHSSKLHCQPAARTIHCCHIQHTQTLQPLGATALPHYLKCSPMQPSQTQLSSTAILILPAATTIKYNTTFTASLALHTTSQTTAFLQPLHCSTAVVVQPNVAALTGSLTIFYSTTSAYTATIWPQLLYCSLSCILAACTQS